MKGRKGRNVTVICRNINPQLRYVLSLFLIEIAPLVYTGKLSSRVCEELWEQLNIFDSKYEITMIINANTEDGFKIKQNYNAEQQNTAMLDGVTVSKRRVKARSPWEKILGKTLPFEYPLVLHLLDTMAVSEILWGKYLSISQKNFISNSLGLSEKEAKTIILFAAGMHDIGKANPYWLSHTLKLTAQHPMFVELPWDNCPDLSENWRHDLTGGVYFSKSSQLETSSLKTLLLRVVSGHHGHFQDDKVLALKEDYEPRSEWIKAQQNIENLIINISDINVELKPNRAPDSITALIAGIVVLSDWIASNSNYIYQAHQNYPSYESHYEASKKIASDFLNKEGFVAPNWKTDLSWGKVFPNIPTPNALQDSMINNPEIFNQPGLLMISAPMGMGKTETSLYAASQFGSRLGLGGIWVALPTRATTNAMFERMIGLSQKIYTQPKNTVSLMHSSALISEATANILDSEGIAVSQRATDNSFSQIYDSDNVQDFISSFLKEKRQGGLSSIVTSTIDQLINVTIPLKHNMLRWVGISGKVLILDEIHDFDTYTFGLIKKLVEWCATYKIPVIAMSATLSQKSQQELLNAYVMNTDSRPPTNKNDTFLPSKGIDSPGWLYATVKNGKIETTTEKVIVNEIPIAYQTELIATNDFSDKIVEIFHKEKENNPTVLVVCNTVNQAVGVYRALKEDSNIGVPVKLLHSRMSETQKTHIINEMMDVVGKKASVRTPHIMVATQIVQQSMDIDYDVLITALTPLPELLQRYGRVHRHETNLRSTAYILNPKVNILVPPDLLNSPTEKSSTVLPYYVIDLLVTLETLYKQGINFNEPYSWKAKINLTDLFNQADLLFTEQKVHPINKGFYNHKQNQEFVQEQKRNEVNIFSPNAIMPSTNISGRRLTAPYTSKSKDAAVTRLIKPTVTTNFISRNSSTKEWEALGLIFDKSSQNLSVAFFPLILNNKISTLKTLSLHSFTIPAYKFAHYEEMLVADPELEWYEKFTKFLDYSAFLTDINSNQNLISEQGLVDNVINPDRVWI